MKLSGNIIFLILSVCPFVLVAQADDEFVYITEKSIGFNFHTNGGFLGGVTGRYSKKNSDHIFTSLSLDIVNIRHNQEVRVPSIATGDNFILGKQNYLFVVRPSLGKGFVIFPPAREEGVQVNLNISAGPSFGIVKPYYIEYDYSSNRDMSFVKEEAYDPVVHRNEFRILGNGSFFKGFESARIAPGFNLKGSVTFFFGNYGKGISGLEAGGLIEGFVKFGNGSFVSADRISIIPFAPNRWLFTALYINIFYGWRK